MTPVLRLGEDRLKSPIICDCCLVEAEWPYYVKKFPETQAHMEFVEFYCQACGEKKVKSGDGQVTLCI